MTWQEPFLPRLDYWQIWRALIYVSESLIWFDVVSIVHFNFYRLIFEGIPNSIYAILFCLLLLNLKGGNQLTGTIPTEIGMLTNLTHFYLGKWIICVVWCCVYCAFQFLPSNIWGNPKFNLHYPFFVCSFSTSKDEIQFEGISIMSNPWSSSKWIICVVWCCVYCTFQLLSSNIWGNPKFNLHYPFLFAPSQLP